MPTLPPLDQWDHLEFGGTLWTPPKVGEPRLVLGLELRVAGQLFALQTKVTSPGPFDTMRDIGQCVAEYLSELEERAATGSDGSCS